MAPKEGQRSFAGEAQLVADIIAPSMKLAWLKPTCTAKQCANNKEMMIALKALQPNLYYTKTTRLAALDLAIKDKPDIMEMDKPKLDDWKDTMQRRWQTMMRLCSQTANRPTKWWNEIFDQSAVAEVSGDDAQEAETLEPSDSPAHAGINMLAPSSLPVDPSSYPHEAMAPTAIALSPPVQRGAASQDSPMAFVYGFNHELKKPWRSADIGSSKPNKEYGTLQDPGPNDDNTDPAEALFCDGDIGCISQLTKGEVCVMKEVEAATAVNKKKNVIFETTGPKNSELQIKALADRTPILILCEKVGKGKMGQICQNHL